MYRLTESFRMACATMTKASSEYFCLNRGFRHAMPLLYRIRLIRAVLMMHIPVSLLFLAGRLVAASLHPQTRT